MPIEGMNVKEGVSMVTVRDYCDEDAAAVGKLIADTYRSFNLSTFSPDEQAQHLGPFAHADSPDPEHRAAIASVLRAKIVLVAERNGDIVGVLRGRPDKLQSLFVRPDQHRRGVGHRLVEVFEAECRRQGSRAVKVQSTLYAVPFYQAQGYRRTTGVRRMRSFDGEGLPYQPMKKVL